MLLIMPISLIASRTPGIRVQEFHGARKRERTRNLEKVQGTDGVIITTYTTLKHNWQ